MQDHIVSKQLFLDIYINLIIFDDLYRKKYCPILHWIYKYNGHEFVLPILALLCLHTFSLVTVTYSGRHLSEGVPLVPFTHNKLCSQSFQPGIHFTGLGFINKYFVNNYSYILYGQAHNLRITKSMEYNKLCLSKKIYNQEPRVQSSGRTDTVKQVSFHLMPLLI